jgi:hypothetical protein
MYFIIIELMILKKMKNLTLENGLLGTLAFSKNEPPWNAHTQ